MSNIRNVFAPTLFIVFFVWLVFVSLISEHREFPKQIHSKKKQEQKWIEIWPTADSIGKQNNKTMNTIECSRRIVCMFFFPRKCQKLFEINVRRVYRCYWICPVLIWKNRMLLEKKQFEYLSTIRNKNKWLLCTDTCLFEVFQFIANWMLQQFS